VLIQPRRRITALLEVWDCWRHPAGARPGGGVVALRDWLARAERWYRRSRSRRAPPTIPTAAGRSAG
jgi:hypothetical protein